MWLPVCLALLMCGCASNARPPSVRLSQRQFYFIGDSGPSEEQFRSSIAAAIAGDDAKLAYVIGLERFTDGESALNFGDLLLQLRHAVGASRLDRVIASLSPDVREGAIGCMKAAEGTRRAYERYAR
jgi:hypothetical protein